MPVIGEAERDLSPVSILNVASLEQHQSANVADGAGDRECGREGDRTGDGRGDVSEVSLPSPLMSVLSSSSSGLAANRLNLEEEEGEVEGRNVRQKTTVGEAAGDRA